MSNLLSQASLVMIPSGYKEDVVYSAVPTNGNGDLSFTRASNGTRVNSAGLVEVVPWNLLQNTNTFSSWDLEGGALTSGFTAPDSTSTAYKYVQVPGGSLYSGSASATSGNKTASVWLKSVSGTSITCIIGDGDASNTTVVSVTGDWQLFTATYTTSTSRPSVYIYGISNASGIYVWHPQLNIGSTAKPYFPTTDRLNVPRLTYQNGGGGCPSLLLEKQSTNLFTYSEQMDNSDWFKNNLTITANSTTSPDGTQNADLLDDGTASSTQHWIYQGTSFSNSTAYTISFYAKYVSRKYMAVNIYNGATSQYVVYDIQNGSVYGSTGDVTASITSVGNGWYRVVYTRTMSASGSPNFRIAMADDSGNETYTGSNKQVYLWGCQCEASSYPTSYIPTTSSSATRVADACSKTGISSLIGQTEGVFYAEFTIPESQSASFFSISDNSSSNRIIFGYYTGELKYYANSSTGSFSINGTIDASPTVGAVYKIAVAYKNNDFVVYKNGTNTVTLTTFTVPANLTAMDNQAGGSSQYIYASVKEILLFKTRLTNSELASITTL